MSKRQRRSRSKRTARRKQSGYLGIIGLIAVAAVIVVVGLVWLNRPQPTPVVVPQDLTAPPHADGKNWGPANVPVVIEEYADFQ